MRNNSKSSSNKLKSDIRVRLFFISLVGIFVNVIFSFFSNIMGLPLYFDSLGTICVAAITGYLFPAICTAVISNTISSFFYEPSIYISFFNAIIGIITVFYARKYSFKKNGYVFIYALIVSLISSLAVVLLDFSILDINEDSLISSSARSFSSVMSISYVVSFWLTTFILYFFEKSFICIIVLILLTVIPKKYLDSFKNSQWNNHLFNKTENRFLNHRNRDIKHPLHKKLTKTFIISSTILVFITSIIAVRLYFDNIKTERIQSAQKCVEIAVDFVDPLKVDEFIKYGEKADGYNETKELLSKILKSSSLSELFVLKNELDGWHYIFDLKDSETEEEPMQPGELLVYDKKLEPYMESVFSEESINLVENKSIFAWHLFVSKPIYDSDGNTVSYVFAEVYLDYLVDFMGSFTIKVLLVIAGFFLIIISYTIWTIGNNMAYPISTIAEYVDVFSDSVENEDKLEENVKQIRSLDIKTGDEIQKLYDAICRMMLSQTEQIRDIRRLSESTLTMQDGLIVTMADMVESRDSDTGAHVQKTAAYVKIIVEGLKKKGYYPQKITPKFMSDVVRSAPLHDVGKINISDTVLNKPGKLTDEEFTIMKTHTTAGKEILEKVISKVQGENYLKEARNMAAYHHERWDGKGYPEGLHGEVIPLSARIMAVADVFDALASPRVYKPAFPLEKSISILKEGSGTQFDPKCVEVFLDSLPEVKMVLKKYSGGSFVELN
ncbi:MAG: HD domain-containing protein [Treponema sp.]|nr:HD domain-containing protein [Treponema sp.]